MSIDNNCRHRGNDERDSPLLLEGDAATGEGDVVIGRKQGNQADDEAADGLSQTEGVEAEPVKAKRINDGPGARR
ncbi:MAG: hypothetical protein NT158_01470 [Cyanobacteria bacterium]|nr:hypothetical protein [Cyanobacteriota bacterium]